MISLSAAGPVVEITTIKCALKDCILSEFLSSLMKILGSVSICIKPPFVVQGFYNKILTKFIAKFR
jgi:hypothetical protein